MKGEIVVQDNSVSQDLLKRLALLHDLQVGIDQLEAGNCTTYTKETLDEFFEEIKRDGRRELELSQSPELIHEWQKRELDRSKAQYDAHPESLLTWEEVQANILAKHQ
jgi:Putative addiction module component